MVNIQKETMNKTECSWPAGDPLMKEYHDTEWGVPLHDDDKLFEFIVLDAFQAGLSWKTILYRRENFRKALGESLIEIGKTDEGLKVLQTLGHKGYDWAQSSDYDGERKVQKELK